MFQHFCIFFALNLEFSKVCDGLGADSTHPEFRLWLSSVSSPYFPDGILQAGIKIVFDPPNRIKENILMYYTTEDLNTDFNQINWHRSFGNDPISDLDFYESCGKLSTEFRKLLYAFCFFHALAMQRTSYLPLGWTEPYQFTEADLKSSLVQLQSILLSSKVRIPNQ